MFNKKRLSLVFFSVVCFLFVVQFAGIVSADPLTDFLGRTFGPAVEGFNAGTGIGDGLTRLLFGIIITILVYSVSNRLPGLSETNMGGPRWLISIIVAILGTSYISSGELELLLTSYSALGFTLGTVLPFLILIFFTYDITTNTNITNQWVKNWLVRGIWSIFGIYILYRLVNLSGSGESFPEIIVTFHYIILGLIILFLLFLKRIVRKVVAGETQGLIGRVEDLTQRAAANEKIQADMLDHLTKP